jgi:CBS domain-containing protein
MDASTITKLDVSRRRATAASPAPRPVAACMRATIARVPGWFTVAQARRVAQLKKVDCLLVDDKAGVSGAASVATLALAPAGDLVARWMVRTSVSVDAGATTAEAAAHLHAAGSACLPVTAGGMLVGTISLADLLFDRDEDRDTDGDNDNALGPSGGDVSHAA